MEEATELTLEDFRQLNLRMRGKVPTYYQMMLSFNPISNLSWVYKEFYDKAVKKDRLDNSKLHFSTFKDNRFLDDAYKTELQALEDIDYMWYKVYTLGEWGSLENLIYKKWEVVDNFPQDVKEVVCGLDFGYTHPTALVMLGIAKEGVYVKQLIHSKNLTISTLIDKIKLAIPEDAPFGRANLNRETPIFCDSARPDAIKQIQQAGLNAKPATKGIHSVKDGIDTIKQHKLYITSDSDALIKEIRQYKWKEDRDGNVYDEPVKLYDDGMDAMRYAAFMTLRKKRPLIAIFSNM
jgi:phage terminase large subunit